MNPVADGADKISLVTTFTPKTSGKHYLSFACRGAGSKLFINNILAYEQLEDAGDYTAFILHTQTEHRFQYSFVGGEDYAIRIESYPSTTSGTDMPLFHGHMAIHVGFVEQSVFEADLPADAISKAHAADLAIVFVGNTAEWETEGEDMADMSLPAGGSQDRLIHATAAANPNTIIVNTTGVPILMPWLSDVKAMLQVWYAGQETGNAIMDILLGETNPSGKLPISWPAKYEDMPCYGNFGLDSRETNEVKYVEDVFIGYRHFDRMFNTEKAALFPFGFGLSYSSFAFDNARLERQGDLGQNGKIIVSVNVENTSVRRGSEVVQVYVVPPKVETNERPLKELAAFAKVHLDAKETKEVFLEFDRSHFAYWNASRDIWAVDNGFYGILVSTSSSLIDIKAQFELDIKTSFSYI